MSNRKLETFLDMRLGDVVVLHLPKIKLLLFWMDKNGDLYVDACSGVIDTKETHNHWMDGSEQILILLAEGVETVEDLRRWESK